MPLEEPAAVVALDEGPDHLAGLLDGPESVCLIPRPKPPNFVLLLGAFREARTDKRLARNQQSAGRPCDAGDG